MTLLLPTQLALVSATLIFVAALFLGVWKFYEMVKSPVGQAHVYVDIAHRAALLYSFATAMFAPLVQFNTWSANQNAAAVSVLVFFFVANIANYVRLGWSKATTNQLVPVPRSATVVVLAQLVAEVGAAGFILSGFVIDQWG